jgi:hypothetical protein
MKKTGLSRPAIVALALTTGFLLALAPAQLVIRKALGSSLYPALMMPSFGAHEESRTVTAPHLALVGVRSDGTERDLDIPGILPRSQTLPMNIATRHFANRSVMEKPETVEWLSRRIHAAYPDEAFSAVRVVWSETTVEVPSGKRTTREDEKASFTIDLSTTEEAAR